MTEKQSIHCSECGLPITGMATDPCPRCGSLDRTVSVHFAEELEVVGMVTVTADDQLVRGRGTVVNPATLTVKATFPQGQIIVVDPRPVLPLGDLSIRMATIDQPTYQAMIGSEALEPFEQFEDALLDLIVKLHDRYYGT